MLLAYDLKEEEAGLSQNHSFSPSWVPRREFGPDIVLIKNHSIFENVVYTYILDLQVQETTSRYRGGFCLRKK